jgi:hypothetical protein
MSERDPRFFDHDETSGLTEYFIFNPDDDTFMIQTQQENESQILEFNAELRKERKGRMGDMTHIAHIPQVIMAKLHQEGIIQDPTRFRRWLNDSDNRMFRTREGKV